MLKNNNVNCLFSVGYEKSSYSVHTPYAAVNLTISDLNSIEVIIGCDNRDRLMKPHLCGTVRFTSAAKPVLVVPNSAVIPEEDTYFVLVGAGSNCFCVRY
jgi:cobalt-zinc-cadmium efflux system membrane fusion protein